MIAAKLWLKALIVLAGAALIVFAALIIFADSRLKALPPEARADKVLVDKSRHRMLLLLRGEILKEYRVSLGRNPIGRKEREGDGRTPEGFYVVDSRKENSSFYRALHISYPTSHEIEAARIKGENPGGAIMIHGLPNGIGWIGSLHGLIDWTAGCIAVTNREIDEIWVAVPDGTPIEIRP